MKASFAKEQSIEIWTFLYENPDIKSKEELPLRLWNKVKYLENYCSLCEYDSNLDPYNPCHNCPLDSIGNGCANGFYHAWLMAICDDHRHLYAGKILKMINDWDISDLD